MWQEDEGGPWHLSIREWLDKELAAKVLANASVTQVVRDAAGSEGLIRLSDPLLHRRVMDLVGIILPAMTWLLIQISTGRHVRRDQLLFGLISPNRGRWVERCGIVPSWYAKYSAYLLQSA